MVSNNRVVKNIPLKMSKKGLFKTYLDFMRPIHKLRNQEIQVVALLLFYNDLYLGDFRLEEDRWRKVFSATVKAAISKELNMTSSVLHNTISSLRKHNVITKSKGYNEVNGGFLLGVGKETESFVLNISFSIK